MSDIRNLLGIVMMLAAIAFMYVFGVQLINDPACVALANGYLMPVAKEFMQVISLCWW